MRAGFKPALNKGTWQPPEPSLMLLQMVGDPLDPHNRKCTWSTRKKVDEEITTLPTSPMVTLLLDSSSFHKWKVPFHSQMDEFGSNPLKGKSQKESHPFRFLTKPATLCQINKLKKLFL